MLQIRRVAILPEGCFGVLMQGGAPFAVTLEATFPTASGIEIPKIPKGTYRCTKTVFHHGKPNPYETYEITGVLGHTRLLFHIANTERDLEGCIGVGRAYDPAGPGILESRVGFGVFMQKCDDIAEFELEIS
jgi:hypothetical protein